MNIITTRKKNVRMVFTMDLSNDKVVERLKIYLERKLQVNPSWPQIADAYREVPISKIIDYLTKNYGKR